MHLRARSHLPAVAIKEPKVTKVHAIGPRIARPYALRLVDGKILALPRWKPRSGRQWPKGNSTLTDDMPPEIK